MQVATLFRESATLLGASMEAASCNGPGNCAGVMYANAGHDVKDSAGSCSPQEPVYTRPLEQQPHRFKPIANESQDDGYETSADMMLSGRVVPSGLEQLDDPYSFVDDDPTEQNNGPAPVQMPQQMQPSYIHPNNVIMDPSSMLPAPRKRGRKKKIKLENGDPNNDMAKMKTPVKERKKHDRFNGMPEEEVSKRTLPDHLTQNLDIIIIGINPGLFAAYKGHHYAGPGNHFWKCLYLSGLTPEQMSADEDYKLLQVGIGFTNMVQRATKGSADLTRKEIKEGSQILLEKLQHFKPKIAVFNGKLIYEVFSGKKDFSFGRQPDLVDGTNTYMWVMPSSSARCAQLPRAADKVPFYAALKKFRDYLNGMVAIIDDSEVVFSEARIKSCFESESRNQYPMDIMDISNATVKKDENGIIPCKKKRGRPKKIKVEGEESTKPPPVKRVYNQTNQLNSDGTKKKRGRPKKIKPEDKPMELVAISDQVKPSVTIRDVSTLSPVQSPVNFCHLQQQPTYNMSNTPTPLQQPPAYMQSPRPQSQPFTHSDLSSEISAAISSEHLESPAPTSPSLDPPDFDPPTNMPTEDTTECCFSSPAPSTTSEHLTPPMIRPITYPSYNTYSPDIGRPLKSEYKVQDMSTKSLSGLESLVDQIPSIAEGEMAHGVAATGLEVAGEQGHSYDASAAPNSTTSSFNLSYPANNTLSVSSLTNPGNSSFSVSSFASGYMNNGNSYPNLMSGSMHPFMEHHNCGVPVPVPLSYHQLPPSYSQQYVGSYGVGPTSAGGSMLHMPSPNYPNGYGYSGYGHGQSAAPTPASYLANHMFDRIKPDPGYGSF